MNFETVSYPSLKKRGVEKIGEKLSALSPLLLPFSDLFWDGFFISPLCPPSYQEGGRLLTKREGFNLPCF